MALHYANRLTELVVVSEADKRARDLNGERWWKADLDKIENTISLYEDDRAHRN